MRYREITQRWTDFVFEAFLDERWIVQEPDESLTSVDQDGTRTPLTNFNGTDRIYFEPNLPEETREEFLRDLEIAKSMLARCGLSSLANVRIKVMGPLGYMSDRWIGAAYLPQPDMLLVCGNYGNKGSTDEGAFVNNIVHELGHRFHFRCGGSTRTAAMSPIDQHISVQYARCQQYPQLFPTEFSKSNFREFWAECFGLFVRGRLTGEMAEWTARTIETFKSQSREVIQERAAPFAGAVTFTDWSGFKARLDTALAQGFTDEHDLCEKVGVNHDLYERLIDSAIGSWRDSPSASLLHGISGIQDGMPQPGAQVFPNILWQTRFIEKARSFGLALHTKKIVDPDWDGQDMSKRILRVSGAPATTLSEDGVYRLNTLLQAIYLYRVAKSRKEMKLPKAIYRGVRASDLYNHDSFKPLIADIWKSDLSHEMKRKEAIDRLIAYIIEHGLDELTDGRVLHSFTASIPTAKYFANGQGFVLRVDPKRVEIVTSELHDPDRVGGEDPMTGRKEREFIIRIPSDYRWSREDVILYDEEYFIAEQNPLCVALFSHDNKQATYTLGGVEITAYWQWHWSGTGGSLVFTSKDTYGETRNRFKARFGFDPLPTEANLDLIANFQIKPRKNY